MPNVGKPFVLDVPRPAQEAFTDAADWLRSLPPPFGGEEAVARFFVALDRELPALCQDIAERFASGSNLPRPDEEASLAFSRPVYKHVFSTSVSGKRKRRRLDYFLYSTGSKHRADFTVSARSRSSAKR